MLRQIVKIANKLDSLGLTKEADVLDRYINKMAANSDVLLGTDIFPKAPETSIRISENFSRRMDQTANFIANGLIRGDTLLNYPKFKSEFKRYWNDMGFDLSPGQKNSWNELEEDYSEKMWKKWGGGASSGTTERPPVSEPTINPAVVPAPVVPEDPWAKSYGARAKELKSVWKNRTTATKKNPSFDNFKAWLKSRSLEGGGVDAIIQKLIMETSTAIGDGVEYDANASIPMGTAREPQSSASAQATGSGANSLMTEERGYTGYRPGPPIDPDFKVKIEKALIEDT